MADISLKDTDGSLITADEVAAAFKDKGPEKRAAVANWYKQKLSAQGKSGPDIDSAVDAAFSSPTSTASAETPALSPEPSPAAAAPSPESPGILKSAWDDMTTPAMSQPRRVEPERRGIWQTLTDPIATKEMRQNLSDAQMQIPEDIVNWAGQGKYPKWAGGGDVGPVGSAAAAGAAALVDKGLGVAKGMASPLGMAAELGAAPLMKHAVKPALSYAAGKFAPVAKAIGSAAGRGVDMLKRAAPESAEQVAAMGRGAQAVGRFGSSMAEKIGGAAKALPARLRQAMQPVMDDAATISANQAEFPGPASFSRPGSLPVGGAPSPQFGGKTLKQLYAEREAIIDAHYRSGGKDLDPAYYRLNDEIEQFEAAQLDALADTTHGGQFGSPDESADALLKKRGYTPARDPRMDAIDEARGPVSDPYALTEGGEPLFTGGKLNLPDGYDIPGHKNASAGRNRAYAREQERLKGEDLNDRAANDQTPWDDSGSPLSRDPRMDAIDEARGPVDGPTGPRSHGGFRDPVNRINGLRQIDADAASGKISPETAALKRKHYGDDGQVEVGPDGKPRFVSFDEMEQAYEDQTNRMIGGPDYNPSPRGVTFDDGAGAEMFSDDMAASQREGLAAQTDSRAVLDASHPDSLPGELAWSQNLDTPKLQAAVDEQNALLARLEKELSETNARDAATGFSDEGIERNINRLYDDIAEAEWTRDRLAGPLKDRLASSSPKGPIGAKKKGAGEPEQGSFRGASQSREPAPAQGPAPSGGGKAGNAGKAKGQEAPEVDSGAFHSENLTSGKYRGGQPKSTGFRAFLESPMQGVRELGHLIERNVDESAPLHPLQKSTDRNVAKGALKLRNFYISGTDKAKQRFAEDAPVVFGHLNDLASPEEAALFSDKYAMLGFRANYKIKGLDYGHQGVKGGGLGANADRILADLDAHIVKKLGPDALARINSVIPRVAAAMDEVGARTVSDKLSPAQFAVWKKNNPFYMFTTSADESLSRAEQSASMDEVFSRHFKTREGFAGIPRMDFASLFTETHMKRIMAQEKRTLVNNIVKHVGKEAKDAKSFASLSRDPRLAEYKIPTPPGVEQKSVFLPKEMVSFIKKADDVQHGIFANMMREASGSFKASTLQYNERFVLGLAAKLRDISTTMLQSRGSLTPLGDAMSKGWNKWMGAIGNKSLIEATPDLEPVLNPAIWMRALKMTLKENFRGLDKLVGGAGTGDPLYASMARRGALQLGPLEGLSRAAMPQHLLSKGEIAKKYTTGILSDIVKASDDVFRGAQFLRTLPQEFRGVKNYGKIVRLDKLPPGFKSKIEDIFGVRATNLDFGMKGQYLRDWDTLAPFSAILVQAPYQLFKFGQRQPMSLAMRTAGFMAASSAVYMRNKVRPDNPLNKFSDQEKDTYIMADTGLRRGNNPVFAPVGHVPEQLRPLWAAVRRGIDIYYEKDPEWKQALKNKYAAGVAGTSLSSYLSLGGPLVSLIEGGLNKSLHRGGDPIEGRGLESLSKDQRASTGTQNIYRVAAEKTGISSPDILKHVARGFGGTVADKVADLTDRPLASFTNNPREDIKKAPARFPVSSDRSSLGPLGKVASRLGIFREGKYDIEKDISAGTVGVRQQIEKDLVHRLKSAQRVLLLSGDEKGKERGRQRMLAVIDEMKQKLGPSGAMPDINDILKQNAEATMYDEHAPHGKAISNVPNKYKAHLIKILRSVNPDRRD